MLELNQIYCGNTFELLEEIDPQSIDLIVCDGPYGTTEYKWDKIDSIQKYNLNLIKVLSPKLKEGGALYLFGKATCIDFIDYRPYLNLRSKIIWWQPSRLSQGRLNYTNNYDIICYFIKGDKSLYYNLDAIRVAQIVNKEHQQRVESVPSVKEGKYNKTKYNSKGKNPGDVWTDIKQLTYKSKELVNREALNTIQKPEKLIERIVLASSVSGSLVLDPFTGTGTCPIICKKHNRNFIAFEIESEYVDISNQRLQAFETLF